jgi:hypothetical protein
MPHPCLWIQAPEQDRMIKSVLCSEDLEGGQLVVLAADSTLPARRTLPLTLRHRGILALILVKRSLLPEHRPTGVWIQFFTLIRIRIRIFTLMRLRILIKVIRNCDNWYTDPPGAPFWAFTPPLWASTALHGSILSLLSLAVLT